MSLAVYPTVASQRNGAIYGCVQKAVKQRVRVIEVASRGRRFPECQCCAAVEVNRQEPCRAIPSSNLLGGSFSNRQLAPSFGREPGLASPKARLLHAGNKRNPPSSTSSGNPG